MKRPVQWRSDVVPRLPGIFAVVESKAISPHGWIQDLDLLGQVANLVQYALHSPGILPRVDDLLPDHDGERVGDIAMAVLKCPRGRPAPDEVGLAQLLTSHLKK